MTLILPTLNYVASDYIGDTNGKPSSLAFTRATTATHVNAIGQIATAASGVLRHDYDPVTGEYLGWLIEDQRSNLETYSEDYRDTAAAGATRPAVYGNVTVSADAATAPDGTATADKVCETAGTAVRSIRKPVTIAVGGTYTISRWFRAGEVSSGIIFQLAGASGSFATTINLAAGTLSGTSASGGYSNASAKIKAFPGGWYRVELTGTTVTDTSANVFVYLNNAAPYAGTAGNGFFMWGGQVEAGAFATSYIPTSSAAATRNADVLTVATSGFGFNASEGTLYVHGDLLSLAQSGNGKVLVSLTEGNFNNEIRLRQIADNSSISANVASGGSTTLSQTAVSGISAGTALKVALGYKSNDSNSAGNGTAQATDNSVTVPSNLGVLDIGHSSQSSSGTTNSAGDFLNGHIRHVAYFPRRLANADLQTITA